MIQPSLRPLADPDHVWLTNARVPLACMAPGQSCSDPMPALLAPPQEEALVAVHIEIQAGKITALVSGHQKIATDTSHYDCQQGLVWPCFVDMHTHIDKSHTWPRQANPTGTFQDALESVVQDQRRYWRPDELAVRMEFALKCSYAHGTRAVRTHLDSGDGLAQISFSLLKELRHQWRNKLIVQGVSLVPCPYYAQPEGVALADVVAKFDGILGAVVYPHPELDLYLDTMFRLAHERGLDLDFHADESLNPADDGLRRIAEAKLRNRFTGAVTVGHCCSLSVQDEATVQTTLQRVRDANLSIVSLPMCNLYLQDRQQGKMPRYRGVTLLPELQQSGIPIALASDNCRDPFFAYGDYDMLEVFTQAVRIGQLDRPIGDWPAAVTQIPATIMGLQDAAVIGVGQPADLLIFRARTLNELLSRPQQDRILMRDGRRVAPPIPDYRELDPWLVS